MADSSQSQTQSPISCFWGTPYLDTDGVWKCPSTPTPPPVTPVGDHGGAMRPVGRRNQPSINIYLGQALPAGYPTMTVPDTPPATTTKIFGMSVPVAIAVGAGLLFLFSSMPDDQSTHRTK